jgi:hypothetical protein
VAAFLTVLAVPGVAGADPDDPDGEPPQTTTEILDAISRAYFDAQVALASSLQRQAEIQASLTVAQAKLDEISSEIGRVAAARYKGATMGLITGLVNAEVSSEQLLAGAAVSEYLLWRDDSFIHEYRVLRDEAAHQNALLQEEIGIQQRQQELLDAQKLEAERALAAEGGLLVTEGYSGGAAAQPAPRNADGSLPLESCDISPDPTTGRGCLTFRTYHMLTEARLADFGGRHVSCWRSGSWGEHPRGRACDFSVFPNGGFQASHASGEARGWGDRLAGWAVTNAEALGVLYVIWYRQIWTPRLGWHRYSGATGAPNTDHTNHVHISMR